MGIVKKALIMNGQMSLSVMDTTDIVNKAIEYHKLSPVCTAALGRTLTACTFMATGLKNKGDKLTVTVKGDGVGGSIVVCGNSNLEMRGYIDNPRVELPLKPNGKLDVSACVGTNGRITVIRDMGFGEPYVGSCRLVSGEIAEDFSAYYTYSEQQPTALALGVRVGVDYTCVGAGGIVLQPMPGCEEKYLDEAENLIGNFANISGMIESMGIDGIVQKFFPDAEFTDYNPVYKCSCSREAIERVILSMGEKEIMETLVRNIMENTIKLSVPLEVDIEFGINWYEAK